MRNCGAFLIVWLTLGVLATLTGCGTKSGASGESKDTKTASINGGANTEGTKAEDSATPKAATAATAPKRPDPQHPVVIIDTSLGSITVNLNAETEGAPLTVANFLWYVNNGHYDRTIFHQVFKERAVLGGGYTAELVAKDAPRKVRNEAANGLKNVKGTIGMVRDPDRIDSANCQFYINLADNKNLDHKDTSDEGYGYCVFGQIAQESWPVVEKIASVEVKDLVKNQQSFEQIPVQPVIINSIRQAR